MKRKGLTIIFFSVMALAVTPRAMQHLRNYAAAAQHQAQVELLRFLLDVGAPASESQPAPQRSENAVACAERVESHKAQPEANRTRAAVQANNAPAVIAQNQKVWPVFKSFELTPVEISKADVQPLEHMRNSYNFETSRHVLTQFAPRMAKFAPQPEGAVAPYLTALADAGYIKALLKSGTRGDKKAQRALQKELFVLAREIARPAATPRVRAERAVDTLPLPVETVEPPPANASKAERCEQDSMR